VIRPEVQSAYPAENVWNYEFTLKNDFDFLDGGLRLNLTFFWTDYDPFQVCQFAGATFFCRGDGDATNRGIELEFNTNPIEGLYIDGFFNILDARVNDFNLIDPTNRDCANHRDPNIRRSCPLLNPPAPPPDPIADDVSGNRLPRAPAWAGGFGIEYGIDLGRWGLITPRFALQFQGRTYFRVFNKKEFSQEPFVKLDSSVRWRSESQRFFGEFFVTNITDEDVINFMFVGPAATGGQVLGQYQPPRLFGIRLGFDFVSDLL
jgi:iron complex outermembrane receptor protein